MTETTKELIARLTGFTPGPWGVTIDEDGNPLSGRPCVCSSDELDCGIVHWDGFVQEYWRSARGDKEIQANAALIAAAPDLHRICGEQADEIERLREALAFYATLDVTMGISWMANDDNGNRARKALEQKP